MTDNRHFVAKSLQLSSAQKTSKEMVHHQNVAGRLITLFINFVSSLWQSA